MNEEEWKDEDFLSFGKNESTEEEEDDDDNMETSSSSSNNQDSDDSIPPWLSFCEHRHTRFHPLTRLHNEIVGFCRLMQPTAAEIARRDKLLEQVKQFVLQTFGEDNVQVDVFGSQATGLFLPSSDIDIVVINKKTQQQEESSKETRQETVTLRKLADALREHWLTELSYLEVIENTRVPLVKMTHKVTNICVDISFDTTSGPLAAQLMKNYLEALPPLRPLTFVIKYFLAARGLNQPYTGGVGSFMLQLMIVAFLQHRERDAVNFKRPQLNNIGAMLLEFFELYGMEFNYITTGISVRHDGFFFPKGTASKKSVFYDEARPFSCALENPLEPTMDVGKPSFRMQTVQRAFAVAYKMLLAHVAEPLLIRPKPSLLATILDPTPEMVERRALVRTQHRHFHSGRGNHTKDENEGVVEHALL